MLMHRPARVSALRCLLRNISLAHTNAVSQVSERVPSLWPVSAWPTPPARVLFAGGVIDHDVALIREASQGLDLPYMLATVPPSTQMQGAIRVFGSLLRTHV